jgi:hypothetical protein
MNWFLDNRELIKHLAVNTGTSANPTYTEICTTSEVKLNTELEEKDFYVYCDAIKRKIVTGAEVSLEGTLKLDVNNEGDIALLDKAHTLISSGEIAQFSNVGIQFDLLSGVEGGVLEYTTYRANVTLSLSDIGGNAEDEAGISFTMSFIGTATEVASA